MDAIRNKKITLFISDEVVSEYLRVLEYSDIRKYKEIFGIQIIMARNAVAKFNL